MFGSKETNLPLLSGVNLDLGLYQHIALPLDFFIFKSPGCINNKANEI